MGQWPIHCKIKKDILPRHQEHTRKLYVFLIRCHNLSETFSSAFVYFFTHSCLFTYLLVYLFVHLFISQESFYYIKSICSFLKSIHLYQKTICLFLQNTHKDKTIWAKITSKEQVLKNKYTWRICKEEGCQFWWTLMVSFVMVLLSSYAI